MQRFNRALLAVFGAAFCALEIQAGVVMVNTSQSPDQPEKVMTNKIYLNQDRVRLEEESGQIAIFRQDKQLFWLIDSRDKSYTEMTKQDLQKIKSRLDEASRQMEEAMKDMPPEQRKMMEQMMAGKMPPKRPETVYQKVASGEKVNLWVCDKYEGSLEGQKKSEVWTADWKDLGLLMEDFTALKEMGEFFAELVPGDQSFYKVGAEADEHHYAGVPIKTITYANGKPASTEELKEIQRQDLASSLFELPEGFKQKKMDMGSDE